MKAGLTIWTPKRFLGTPLRVDNTLRITDVQDEVLKNKLNFDSMTKSGNIKKAVKREVYLRDSG